MKIANTPLTLKSSSALITAFLEGKTVRYFNKGLSSVTKDGVRTFKIEEIKDVFVAKSSGRKCIKALVRDVDDGGESKNRCMQISGIQTVV